MIAPTANGQNAVFDFRQTDLEENTVLLQGEWRFEYGQLLTAEEMLAVDSPTFVSIPHTWTGMDFKGKRLPVTGFATYYTKVVVNDKTKDLALNGRVQATNYRLFINGKDMGGVGTVGQSARTAKPNYRNKIYILPQHEDTLEVVLHISNYHYRKGEFSRAPILGGKKLLLNKRTQDIAITFFLIGSIFFMGLYHIASNFFRLRSQMNTYFSLVCLCTILRTLSVNEYLLIEYFNFPWWLSTRVELISFYLLLAFTVRFIYHLFPSYIPKYLANIPYYIAVSASVITIFIPILYSSHFVPIMQVTTVISGITLLYYIFKASLTGDKEVALALIGFVLLFAVTVIDILTFQKHFVGNMIFGSGIFFYLFSHVLILANRKNQTYQKNEDLSIALKQANQLLEKKVEERTRELNERNFELVANNQELKQLYEEKNGLIHILAHDLKSPLNNNKGLVRLLKKPKNLSEKQTDYLDKLEKSNQQGVQLIEDLLHLYKMESTQIPEIKTINPVAFFEEVFQKHKDIAGLKKIEIIKKIQDQGRTFNTDPTYLLRIMDNLISNALKFSYENSTIEINATQRQKKLEIEIKDHGMGISKKDQKMVFQKFQKMSNKPTAGESSSGLGLSIVKTLVSKLKGTIDFESESGIGTSFKIILPDLGKKP